MKLPRSASIFQRQNAGTGAGFIENNQRPFLKLRLKLAKRIAHQLANRGRRHILRANLNHTGTFRLGQCQQRTEIQIVGELSVPGSPRRR